MIVLRAGAMLFYQRRPSMRDDHFGDPIPRGRTGCAVWDFQFRLIQDSVDPSGGEGGRPARGATERYLSVDNTGVRFTFCLLGISQKK